jgi:hypothetical protein
MFPDPRLSKARFERFTADRAEAANDSSLSAVPLPYVALIDLSSALPTTAF